MGSAEEGIRLVIICFTTIRYNIYTNEELIGPMIPEHGLRQGDPLLPYLFILCVEGLTAILNNYTTSRRIHGCKVAIGAPIVSHIFFADDAYLFFRATPLKCSYIKEIL